MIVTALARILIREHFYKPVQGKVLTLGKQKINMTYEEATDLFRKEVCESCEVAKDMDDKAFFRMFGVNDLFTMDIRDADIIHNLNYPIDKSLYEQFDFIIDGGTFDHLFDIRIAFENVVRMLKPGGRILQQNAASNFTGASYLSFSPDFFHDYYIVNGFADCRVYLAEIDSLSQGEWDLYEFEIGQMSHFPSPHLQMVIVLAEKGKDSTWDKMPIQTQYGGNLVVPTSKREHLPTVKGKGIRGYRYVGKI